MKIIERKNDEFKFDNGAWVRIIIENRHDGSFEYQLDEDDEDTYSAGGLWFDGDVLEDYDGCYELPEEVIMALHELGYKEDL